MASNVYIEEDFHYDGAVDVAVEDLNTGNFVRFGRFSGVDFSLTVDKRQIEQVNDGVMTKVKDKVKRRGATLRMNMLERSPDVNQLQLGEYGDTQTIVTTPTMKSLTINQRLYGTDTGAIKKYPYFHDHVGYATQDRLAPITSVTGTYVAAGGTGWTTGSNYFWVVPLYAGKNAKTDVANSISLITSISIGLLNVGWHGYKDQKGYFTSGTPVASGAVSVLHVTGKVNLSLVQAALDDDEPLPDGWAIFQSTSNSIYGAKLAVAFANTLTRSGGTVSLGGTNAITKPAHASSQTYAYGTTGLNGSAAGTDTYGLGMQKITYGTTPTYTQAVYATDYSNDQSAGQYGRAAASTVIVDGDMVAITLWFIEAASVENNVGSGGRNSDYRQVMLTAISADDTPPSGEVVLGEGDYWILEKVNFAGLAVALNFDEENFRPGSAVECECLSSSNNRFGRARIVSRKNFNYVQKFS